MMMEVFPISEDRDDFCQAVGRDCGREWATKHAKKWQLRRLANEYDKSLCRTPAEWVDSYDCEGNHLGVLGVFECVFVEMDGDTCESMLLDAGVPQYDLHDPETIGGFVTGALEVWENKSR